MTPEQIGLYAGLLLSLMVFSYLLADNFLYRLAVYIFIGLAAAFTTLVTVESVLLPWLNNTVLSPTASIPLRVAGLIPVLLGVLLLLKTSPRLGRIGNLAIAFIVGVGAAVAIVGALTGTLLPLTAATGASVGGMTSETLLNTFLVVLGVVSTLIAFQFTARRLPNGLTRQTLAVRVFGAFGRGFIVVALGALYASAILTGLTIFSERLAFIFGSIPGG
jgi:hypothetical protein